MNVHKPYSELENEVRKREEKKGSRRYIYV